MQSTNPAKDESWKDRQHVFPPPSSRTENIINREEAILLDNQEEEEKELQIKEAEEDSKPPARESPHLNLSKDKQETEAFHMEILLGLFLRSSEEELQQLAQKAGVSNTLFKNTQCKTSHSTEEMKQDSIDKPSQMPIVAHVLRDISQDCISSQTQLSKQQILSLFPQKYKRENYAARTISELSSHILDKFMNFTNANNVPLSSTEISHPVLQSFPLEYNECSINTFCNWAFATDTPKEENVNYYYQPHAPFTFQQCGICRRYGHVEVECEELVKRNISQDVQQALEMEQKVLDETRIQHSLREFILEERLHQNCKELAMEQQYVSYPWMDIRTGKVSEEQCVNSSTGLKQSQQGLVGMYTLEQSQHGNTEESLSDDDIDPCRTCGSNFSPADLLMCDGCDETFHRQCLVPPLDEVPEGDWFCDSCKTYDSEVDSITVIEGLDDFVIEQRKLSSNLDKLREREAEGGVGYKSNPFDASMVVAPVDSVLKDRESPSISIEDGIFLQDIRDDGDDPIFDTLSTMMLSSSRTLDIGDLCWAKRRCSRTKVAGLHGKDFFWPAIVIEVHSSSTAYDGVKQTPYIVKMFNVPAGGRLRASAILPFFEFFDELGLQRLEAFQDKQPSWWQPFSKGLREAINEAGFDSYENALAFSKQILRDDDDSNVKGNQRQSAAKKFIKPKKYCAEGTRPSEWDDAEVTEIDGITILTKRSELEAPNVVAKESLSSILEVDENVQNQSREKTLEDEIDENQKFSLHSLDSEELKKVPIEKLVGGLVAYSVADSKSEERIIFGKCLKYNRAFGKALIQNISNFESIIDGYSEKTDSNLIACNVRVGSTQWIDLGDLFFLNRGLQDGSKKFCSSILANTLQKTRAQLSTLSADIDSEDEVSLDEISLEETSISSVELGEKVAVETGEVFDSMEIGEKDAIEEKTLDKELTLEKEAPERTLEDSAILKKGSQIIESKTKAVTDEELKSTGDIKDNIISKGRDTLEVAKRNTKEGSMEDKAVSSTQIAQEVRGSSAEVIEKRIGSTAVSTLTFQEHKEKRDSMSEVERNEAIKALLLESRKSFITQMYGEDALDATAQISQEVKHNAESTKDSIIEDRIEDVAVSITKICQKEMEMAENIKDSINEDTIEDQAISTAGKPLKVKDNIEIIASGTEARESSIDNKSQEAKDTTESLKDSMNEGRMEDEQVATVLTAQKEMDTIESVKDSTKERKIEDEKVSKPQIDQEAKDITESLKESIDEGGAISIDKKTQEAKDRIENELVSTVRIAQTEIDTLESLKESINEGRIEEKAVPKYQIDQDVKDTVENLKESIDEAKAISIDNKSQEAVGTADGVKASIIDSGIEDRVSSDVQVSQEAKDTTENLKKSIDEGRVVSIDQVSQEAKDTVESLKESIDEGRVIFIDQVSQEEKTAASLKSIDEGRANSINQRAEEVKDTPDIVEGRIEDSVGSVVQVPQEAKNIVGSLTESVNKGRIEEKAVSVDQASQEAKDTTESLKKSISKSRKEYEVVSTTPIAEEAQDHAESSKKSINDRGGDGVSLNVLVDTEGKNSTESTKDSFSVDMMGKVSEVEAIETSKTTDSNILERVGNFESSEKVKNTIDHSAGHLDAIANTIDSNREVSSDNVSETPVLPGTLAAIATREEKSIESTKKQSKAPPALSTLHSIELLLNKNRSKRKKNTENQSTIKNDVKKQVEKRSLPISDQNVINQKVDTKQKKNENSTSFASNTDLEGNRSALNDEGIILPACIKQSASQNLMEKTYKVQDPVNQEGNSIPLPEAITAEDTLDRGSNVKTTDALVSIQKTAISADIDLSVKEGIKGQADQGAIPVNSRNDNVSNRTPVENQNKMGLISELSKNVVPCISAVCREKETVGVTTKDVVDTVEVDATAVAIQDSEEKVDVTEVSLQEIDETKQSNADTNESSIKVFEEEKSGAQNVEIDLKVSKVASKSDSEVVEDVETIDKSISSSALEKLENIGGEKSDKNVTSGDNTGKAAIDAELKGLQQSEKDNSRPVANATENLVGLNLQTSKQKDRDSSSPVTAVDEISNTDQKVQDIDSSMDISKSSGEDMDISISSGESEKAESTKELGEVIAQKNLDLKIENSNIPANAVSNCADKSLLATLSLPKPFGVPEDEEDKGLRKGASGTNTTLENTTSKEKRERLDIEVRPTDSASTVLKVKSDAESSKVVISDKTSIPKVPVPPIVIEIKESDESVGSPTIDTIQKLNERPKKKRQIDLTGVTFKSTSPPKSEKEINTTTSLTSQKDTSFSKKKVSDTVIVASPKPKKKIIEEGLTSPRAKKLSSDSTTTSSPKKRTSDTTMEIPLPKKRATDSTTSSNSSKKKTDETTVVVTTPKNKTDEAAANASNTKGKSSNTPIHKEGRILPDSMIKAGEAVVNVSNPKKKAEEPVADVSDSKKYSSETSEHVANVSSTKKKAEEHVVNASNPKKAKELVVNVSDLKKKSPETGKSSANVSSTKKKAEELVVNVSNPKKKAEEPVADVSNPKKKSSETEATITDPKKKHPSTSMLTPKKRPNEAKNSSSISKRLRESPPSKSLVGIVEKRVRTPTHKISSDVPAEAKKPKAKAKEKAKAKKKNPSSAEKPKASKKRKEEIIVDDVVVDPINTHERADEGIFYVERIIDDRTKNRNKEYLIKWKGYSDEHNTWEKEENILDPIFLKKYLCVKYIAILTATPEGKKEGTTTRNIVTALKRGIVLMDQKPPKELSNNRVCPLCLNLKFDHKKFGGHVRKHKDEANYVHLKEIARFAEKTWFKK
ncbi:predicted protein [Chaetoceros tenuissimus]|uniref:PHD-type domain-containing protein n=1 Tax=Chaetoceros tenuissimus TaxID=426638 RepID=A0AAD3GZ02_9STRA|nr:predicted protein [Chaetoceros tenuissimus]